MNFDALAHLKQWVNIDKPKTAEEIAKDKDYDEKWKSINKDTRTKMQLEAFKNIYWIEQTEWNDTKNNNIVSKEDTDKHISWEEMDNDIKRNSETEENIIDNNHSSKEDYSNMPTEEDYIKNKEQVEIKSSKEYPLVKTFLSERNINNDSLSLDKDWKIDVNAIEWLNYEDKEILTWLLVNIEWDNRAQNRIDFSTNIKDMPEFSEYDLTFWDNWFDNGVLNRIWDNYIDIPDSSWKIDVEKNISISIEVAKNEILKEAKNVKPDSQTYKTAIANIESWDLKKQLEWINSLYYLAFSSEWKLWAKDSLNAHKNKRKKELISDANILDAKQQIALNNNNTEEFKKLDKQKDIIISEVKELVKWEIFEASDFDIMAEGIHEWKEQV